MRGLAGGPLFRITLALPLAGLGALVGYLAEPQPWALLATTALIVGVAQQTLP